MKRNSTARKVKITPAVQEAYGKRDKRLDKADTDNPVLPPEIWATGVIGKFYRPRKTAVSLRVDNDVLQWLKSKGEGHLTRINEILRQHMLAERK